MCGCEKEMQGNYTTELGNEFVFSLHPDWIKTSRVKGTGETVIYFVFMIMQHFYIFCKFSRTWMGNINNMLWMLLPYILGDFQFMSEWDYDTLKAMYHWMR